MLGCLICEMGQPIQFLINKKLTTFKKIEKYISVIATVFLTLLAVLLMGAMLPVPGNYKVFVGVVGVNGTGNSYRQYRGDGSGR
jgi:hypothetical protein